MLTGRIINWCFFAGLLLAMMLDWRLEISSWIYAGIAGAYLLTMGFGSAIISSQFFIPVRCQGERDGGSIAITFDDGPVSGKTDLILDILKKHQAPAAFFCVGSRVNEQPGLVRRMYDEGHIVGNHSYVHGILFDLQSPRRMKKELLDTDSAIEQSIGRKPRFFRPPYGVTNPMLANAVSSGGYTAVGWNVRSFDTVITGKEKLLRRITGKLKAGDLILFHDHAVALVEVLPGFLEVVKKKGLRIERLDKLLHENPYV